MRSIESAELILLAGVITGILVLLTTSRSPTENYESGSKTKCKGTIMANELYNKLFPDNPQIYDNHSPQLMYDTECSNFTNSSIVSLKKYFYKNPFNIDCLAIRANNELQLIEPEAFKGFHNLWKLEIYDNPKLSSLHEQSLKGLTALKGLFLKRNNITNITDISRALSSKYVPNLVYLDLSGNRIFTVGQFDFTPMKGVPLYSLIMGFTKTSNIHPLALDPFGESIHHLYFSDMNVNSSVLVNFISRTTVKNPNLNFIFLEQNLLFCGPPHKLMEVMVNNTVGLSLKKNHLGLMTPGFFPVMRKLKYLDLSDVVVDYIPDGVINSTVFPQLKHLYLSNNKITRLTPTMVTQTITRFILRKDDDNRGLDSPQLRTQFQIEDNTLNMMPNLKLLDLTGNNLIELTEDLLKHASNLRVLLLSKTSLLRIASKTFEKNSKLFYLDLSFNPFPKIHPLNSDIFYGLSSLLALDLSYCVIDILPDDIFLHTPQIQYLSLRGNAISILDFTIFPSIPQLKILDMRFNTIVSWDNTLFDKQGCLLSFMLEYNNIRQLTKAMLQDFKKTDNVQLFGNAITCNCDLYQNIHNVFNEPHINWKNVSYFNKTKCSYPENDVNIYSYLQITFEADCLTYTTSIIAGSVAILVVIIVTLILVYCKYKYEIQYHLILLKKKLGITNVYRKKNGSSKQGQYQYDAFVSYSAHDNSFVEKMMCILEKNGSKFKLCVFERDFQPGDNLVDKILNCMEISMVTILILTDSFAKSEWCRWEMSIAQNRLISQQFLKDSLILVIKSPIDDSLMTPTLRYLMDTRVYLEWHESSTVRQKIFWEKLKDALRERTRYSQLNPDNNESYSLSCRKHVPVLETRT